MINKNILIISCVFPPEAVTSASTSLDTANALASMGHKVTIICPKPSRSVDLSWKYEINDSINVIRIPSVSNNNSTFMKIIENFSFGISAYIYLFFRKSFDICYMNSWPLISTFLISSALKLKKTKYIYSVQDLYPDTLVIKGIMGPNSLINKFLEKIEKSICMSSHKVVTISKSFEEYLIKQIGVNKEKIVIISNWSSDDVTLLSKEKAWKIMEGKGIKKKKYELTLAYGGNISTSTGIYDFSNFLTQSNLNIQLLVAGNGSLEKSIYNISEHDQRFSLLSPWPKQYTNALYSLADILVLPVPPGQEHGSVPSKLINYMKTGKPILCICNSDSSITEALYDYTGSSLIISWEDLNKITRDELLDLCQDIQAPSYNSPKRGEIRNNSLNLLLKEILN